MTPSEPSPQADRPADTGESVERLVQDLDRWIGMPCADCQAVLCGHQVLASIYMGAKDAPRCVACIAARLGEPIDEFRDRLVPFLLRRPCYAQAWQIASEREGLGSSASLPCIGLSSQARPLLPTPLTPPIRSEYNGEVAETWDAGDLGCGDLVLQLRIRLQRLASGAVMRVIALDPGAPEDLPAWCRMTRNALLASNHPEYLIQRKEG